MNDDELRERMLAGVPDHRSGFWSDLSRTLATAAPERSDAAVPLHPQGDTVSTTLDQPADLDAYRSSSAIRGRRNRWLAAAGWTAAAAVVIGAGTVALRLGSGRQDQTPAVTTSASPTPVSSAAAGPTPSTVPSANPSTAPSAAVSSPASSAVFPHVIGEVPAQDALAQLRRAGVTPIGDVLRGIQWTDLNGDNMVVLERDYRLVTVGNRRGWTGSLTVVHLAHFETARPTVLRTLTQPMLPGNGPNRTCGSEVMLDYVKDSLQVRDVDGDGYSEVSVAWYMLCGGGQPNLDVRLAYLTKGTYYILRGTGLVRSIPFEQGAAGMPKATYTIWPDAASWPNGLVDQARADFDRYFN